jgi:hypothetical protein
VRELYPNGYRFRVEPHESDLVLEGSHRPGFPAGRDEIGSMPTRQFPCYDSRHSRWPPQNAVPEPVVIQIGNLKLDPERRLFSRSEEAVLAASVQGTIHLSHSE